MSQHDAYMRRGTLPHGFWLTTNQTPEVSTAKQQHQGCVCDDDVD